MAKQAGLNIRCNADAVTRLLDQMEAAVEADPSLKKILKALFNVADFGIQIAAVDGNNGSAAAGESVVRLEPTDRFRRIAAAVAAGDVNSLVLEHKRLLSESVRSDERLSGAEVRALVKNMQQV